MKAILEIFSRIFGNKDIRDKVLFTIYILIAFRVLAHITIPGTNIQAIQSVINSSSGYSGVQLLGLLSGGALEHFSIVLMGLTPYINASIIMQLLAVIIPSLERLKKEGEIGQKKITQYTRILALPLALLQAFGMISLLNRFSPAGDIVDMSSFSTILFMILMVAAGTFILMWLGELITEKGIGNGVSLIIFTGIISIVPQQISSSLQSTEFPIIATLIAATIALIAFVVYVSEGERRVEVVYTSQQKTKASQKSFLPLKINQSGMIPIIFAISLVSFPSIISQFMVGSNTPWISRAGNFILTNFNPSSPTALYLTLYAFLIFGFTYFYVSLVFDPKKISDNIQKRSGYIPGYRPGKETEILLRNITFRLCFFGGAFLASVAIVPLIFEGWISNGTNAISLFISGAGIIIVVSVVLDLIRRLNTYMVDHNYEKL